MRSLILFFALLGTTQWAVAQSPPRLNPADSGVAVPVLQPQSAFADYQSFREQKSNSWKQMNDEVAANPSMGAMSSMKGRSEKTMSEMNDGPNAPPMKDDGDGESSMTRPQSGADHVVDARTNAIFGTGVVRNIDKANAKVQLMHEPIDALGWPTMTMFFRLKDSALADRINVGDKVDFFLEKSGSGYVISGFGIGPQGIHQKQMK